MIRFAIQALPNEGEQAVAEVILRTADFLGLSFKFLDLVDWFPFGSQRMLIVGADIKDTKALCEELAKSKRAFIRMEYPTYYATIGTRKAAVPSSSMLMAKRLQKVYRGPADPLWQQQFKGAQKG